MAKTENTSKKAVKMVAPKKLDVAVVKKDAKKKDETVKTIADLQQELVVKRMELMMGKLKDVRSISKTQDVIARMKTAVRIKELTTV
ncbi:MAG TPA: 50S ribosomal protein L29 [Candidatus Saccharimonadia bacterium]|nr:50S ribosomal protein L29 [Candidatus Saccharimonadia bacterium]